MSNRFGYVIANVMSVGARGLGLAIYWLLRAIYRPRERAIALGGIAVLVAALVVYWATR